jgi:hypothetical protein
LSRLLADRKQLDQALKIVEEEQRASVFVDGETSCRRSRHRRAGEG